MESTISGEVLRGAVLSEVMSIWLHVWNPSERSCSAAWNENGNAFEERQFMPGAGNSTFSVPSGKREGKATSGAETKANGGVRASSERNNDTYECFENENRRHAFCLHFVGKPLVGGAKLLFWCSLVAPKQVSLLPLFLTSSFAALQKRVTKHKLSCRCPAFACYYVGMLYRVG